MFLGCQGRRILAPDDTVALTETILEVATSCFLIMFNDKNCASDLTELYSSLSLKI